MLNTNDRTWLMRQQEALISASTKATIYHDALALLMDVPTPSWVHPIKRWRRRQETRRLTERWNLWVGQAIHIDTVVSAWLDIHDVTTGNQRGPIYPNGTRAAKTVRTPDE